MNTVSFNTNYATHNNKSMPAFRGNLGRFHLNKIDHVTQEEIIETTKGSFGLKTEKVKDVIEEFVDKLKEVSGYNKSLTENISNNENKMAELKEKQANLVKQAEESEINHFNNIIKRNNNVVAESDKKIAELNKFTSQYNDYRLNTFDEVEPLMPKQAIETMKEMAENKESATDSMFNFLINGKLPEESIKQLNRATILGKTRMDGVTEIPEVKEAYEIYSKQGANQWNDPLTNTVDMMRDALMGNQKGSYIMMPKVKEQVKTNAMALLTQVCDNNRNTTEFASKQIDNMLNEVAEFHKNFANGKKKLKRKFPKAEVEFKKEGYNINDSVVNIYENGEITHSWSYNNFSYWGKSNQ